MELNTGRSGELSAGEAEPDDAHILKNMPTHYIYAHAPDDMGRLLRVGAMWVHESGVNYTLRLDRSEWAKQLVFECGDDLMVLQNKRRLELAERVDRARAKDRTFESFDQAAHPSRMTPG